MIIIILSILSFVSCEKDKNTATCTGASFIFLNENGEDIFNKNTLNHIDTSDFEAYTPEGRQMEFRTDTLYGINHFDIWINGEMDLEGTTYLKFGELTIDTIYAKFEEKGNSLFIRELYYNGILLEKNEGVTQCLTKVHEITVLAE